MTQHVSNMRSHQATNNATDWKDEEAVYMYMYMWEPQKVANDHKKADVAL